jgi:hypothetical protein
VGPYLRLAASLRSLAPPGSGLSPHLRELLDELRAEAQTTRKAARKRMLALGAEDRLLVARELTEIVRTEPDSQDRVGEALQDLLQDQGGGEEILRRLEDLDPATIVPGLLVRISRDGPVKAQALRLIERWRDSGRMGEIAGAAATNLLDDQGGG